MFARIWYEGPAVNSHVREGVDQEFSKTVSAEGAANLNSIGGFSIVVVLRIL